MKGKRATKTGEASGKQKWFAGHANHFMQIDRATFSGWRRRA
jgi:hypothetical protein